MGSYFFIGTYPTGISCLRYDRLQTPGNWIVAGKWQQVSEFQYDSYEIIAGKPKLSGLPATYTESEEEAQTLRIFLKDALTGAKLALLYTIFDEYSAIARSAYIENAGVKNLHVLNMMSLSLDLPDKDYGWWQMKTARLQS